MPDPQRAFVVRAKIVTSDILLTKLVIICLGSVAEAIIGPLDGGIIDLSAAVACFIGFSKVSKLFASFLLDGLTGAEFGLDLSGSNWIVSRIQLVEEVILVL